MSFDAADPGPAPPQGFHGARFPSTRWSLLRAERGSGDGARRALEELAGRYWRPVAAYVRTRWARDDEEALDATQAFFLWLLESELFARADPERGSFRGFLKRALEHFVVDLERRRRSLKRGGGRRFFSLDAEAEDGGPSLDLPDPEGRRPDQILDEVWRAELLEEAARGLERELAGANKSTVFAVFRDYFLSDEELDYAAVAERHGITKATVSNHLMYAKRRYRAQLKRAVLETVAGDEDLRAELEWVFEGDGE